MEIGLITTFEQGIEATTAEIRRLGIHSIQYLYLAGDDRSPAAVERINAACADADIEISGVFCTYAGMDYSTIQKGIETGGLAPPATRKERLEETKRIAELARAVGARAVIAHYGAIPEETDNADYRDLIRVTRELCDHCADLELTFNLETGEDSTATLLQFIKDVDRDNLGINFDPANMILYGKAEPLKALREVARHVISCHCKDAAWSDKPGIEWGREVRLGDGEVNIPEFVRTLGEIGYDGPLTIEREVHGEERIRDILHAKQLLNKCLAR